MVHRIDLNLKNLERQQRRQQTLLGVVGGATALAAALGYVLVEPTSLLIPVLILTVTLLPIILWYFPRFVLYVILAATCLFELQPTIVNGRGITDIVPFFWNVNTMFEVYVGTNPKLVAINFFELLLILYFVVTLMKMAFLRREKMLLGSLFLPVFIYICFVSLGCLNGLASGGDFNDALREIRAQFYFFIVSLLTLNFVKGRAQVDLLLWMMPILVGLKAVNYIYRWYAIYQMQIPDQGVGSHEESFFFIAFVCLLVVLCVAGIQPRLRALMWTLLPLIMFANATTNRRASYAALIITLPLILLAGYKGFPRARRGIVAFFIALSIIVPPYFLAFRNSTGALGGPARAIQSTISPNERDAASNQYRDNENFDLFATLRSQPTTIAFGFGYGKRFLTPISLDSISSTYPFYNLLPHNQILWVWMRLGTLGFLAFWGMVASILIYACRIVRRTNLDSYTRAIALYAMALMVLLLLFALLDLQLSNFRDMIFVASWIGAMVAMFPKGFTLNDSDPVRSRSGEKSRHSRLGRP